MPVREFQAGCVIGIEDRSDALAQRPDPCGGIDPDAEITKLLAVTPFVGPGRGWTLSLARPKQ